MRALTALTAVALAAVAATRADGFYQAVAGRDAFHEVAPSTTVSPIRPTATASAATTAAPTTAVNPSTTTTEAELIVPTVVARPAPPLAGADFAQFDYALAGGLRGAQAISIAIAQDGRIVHTFASGYAEPTSTGYNDLVTPDSRFRIASNSKTITSIVVLQLVEAGKLGLDDPVLSRLADRLGVTLASAQMQQVTVRQLLMHRSGFSERFEVFFRGGAYSCEDAARRGLTEGLSHSPGQMEYSNMNYCLLGLLIEDVTQLAYERVVDEMLLQPLGIVGMRTAKTHDVQPGDVRHVSGDLRDYMEALGGAGAWIATASDLVRIVDSLDPAKPGWHPLSPETAMQMYAPPAGSHGNWAQWYGLGLRCWGDGSWGHTGTVESSRSMMLHRPDGITWAVVAAGNTPYETDDLRKHVDAAFAAMGA